MTDAFVSSLIEHRLRRTPVFPPRSVWQAVPPVVIAGESGKTTAVTPTTVALSRIPGIVVPVNTALALYKIDAFVTANPGNLIVHVYHNTGGNPVLSARAESTAGTSQSGFVDTSRGELTYSTTIGGSPTYQYAIYLCGFLKAP